jgi:2-polyprenyl-6-hydroxyphenyl methylase/3-demethylubiquinone-9 3-methyltransferase
MSGQSHCKICGSGDAPVRFLLYRTDVAVRRCRDCGFTFVDYRADEEHLVSSGHDLAGVPDAEPSAAAKWERRLKIYAQYGGGLSGKRLLDVGAGGGSWLAAARAAGAEVCGTEFCETCREYARAQFALQLEPHVLEDTYWQSRAGTFDVVTFWDVLEHVNEPREFLQQAAAMVRPGGHLMLSTPVRDTWFDRAGETAYRCTFGRAGFLLQQRYSHTHLQIFHSQQLKSLLVEAGFRALYYRKVQELTLPFDRYFRNMYGKSARVELLARCAAGVLRVAPLANKVLGLFEKQ